MTPNVQNQDDDFWEDGTPRHFPKSHLFYFDLHNDFLVSLGDAPSIVTIAETGL